MNRTKKTSRKYAELYNREDHQTRITNTNTQALEQATRRLKRQGVKPVRPLGPTPGITPHKPLSKRELRKKAKQRGVGFKERWFSDKSTLRQKAFGR